MEFRTQNGVFTQGNVQKQKSVHILHRELHLRVDPTHLGKVCNFLFTYYTRNATRRAQVTDAPFRVTHFSSEVRTPEQPTSEAVLYITALH